MTDTSTDLLKRSGRVRTDIYCHECNKSFIAVINHDLTGNHIVECAYCGHEHCRVIEGGVVTGRRWDSRYQRVDVEKRSVWKHDSQPIQTSSASHYMRDIWLNRSDAG